MAQKKIILTGDRPTGRLHLGHYVGSLKRRVQLQNSGIYDEIAAVKNCLLVGFFVCEDVRPNWRRQRQGY